MTEPRLIVLTPQQRAVLGQLTWDGADNATIAARMVSPEHTVKTHKKRMAAAFGTSNRVAIVTDCLRGRVVVKTYRRPSQAHREEPA